MAAFTYVRGLGLWVNDSVITQAELEEIESRWPKILHADGGSWTPSADIELLGSNSLKLGGGQWLKTETRSITIQAALIPIRLNGDWEELIQAASFRQIDIAGTPSSLVFTVPALPIGMVTAVRIALQSAVHSALPGTMPQLTVRTANELPDLNATQVGIQVDTSANTTAFATEHFIEATISPSVSSVRPLILWVRGESGSDSELHLQVSASAEIDLDITTIQPQ